MILPLTLSLSAVLMTARADSIPDRPPYEILPAGAVKPRGWMLEQLNADLQRGISGNYDKFHSDAAGQIFAEQNRVPGTKVMGSRGMNEKAWWAGEVEGNWHDGLVRAAILADSEPDIARIFFGATSSEDIGGVLREANERDDINLRALVAQSPLGEKRARTVVAPPGP